MLTAATPACPLQRLFKNDRVPHGWMAVSRYEEIEADFTATYQEGEAALRTAILINCGAAEDVRQLLKLEDRMNVRLIIIDSHRWEAWVGERNMCSAQATAVAWAGSGGCAGQRRMASRTLGPAPGLPAGPSAT